MFGCINNFTAAWRDQERGPEMGFKEMPRRGNWKRSGAFWATCDFGMLEARLLFLSAETKGSSLISNVSIGHDFYYYYYFVIVVIVV